MANPDLAPGALQKPRSRAAEKKQADREAEKAWQSVRREVLARDRHMCRFCGSRDRVEVHHLKPRSLGREDSTRNAIALCAIHHAERHAYRLFLHGSDANGRIRFEIVDHTTGRIVKRMGPMSERKADHFYRAASKASRGHERLYVRVRRDDADQNPFART